MLFNIYTLFLIGDKIMNKISKGLLFASLLALGAGATTAAGPLTTKAAVNTDYGYTAIGSSLVRVRDTGALIYNSNGESTGRSLPMGSTWRTDLSNTLSGGTYYGIGKDEYVKASDVDYYSTVTSGYGQELTNYDGVEVTASYGAALYDANGNPLGRTLPVGSDWKTDYESNTAKGTLYRVATGEYVSGSDVRVYQNSFSRAISETITTKAGAPTPLYNGNGQLIGTRALGPNTKWYTDEFSNIGHVGYYRVASNEYVIAADVD